MVVCANSANGRIFTGSPTWKRYMSVEKLARHAYIRRHGTATIPGRAMGDWMHETPLSQHDTEMADSHEYDLSPASNLFPFDFPQTVQSLPHEQHDPAFSAHLPPWDTHGINHNRFVNYRTQDPRDTALLDHTLPKQHNIDYEEFDPGAAKHRATKELLDDSISVLTPRPHDSQANFDPNASTLWARASAIAADKTWNPNASYHTSQTEVNDAYCDMFDDQLHNDFSQMPDFRHLAHIKPIVRACFLESPGAELDSTHRVCMLSKHVFSQEYAETDTAVLRICTVGKSFKIAGLERVKWPVQMLIEATQGLRYNSCIQNGERWYNQKSWHRLTPMEVVLETGKLFLHSTTIDGNSELPSLSHFFSPRTKYYQTLLECRQRLRPEMYTNEPLNKEHNNEMYAKVAMFFLTKCCKAMFAAETVMKAKFETYTDAVKMFPGNFMGYVDYVMEKIDSLIQQYNEIVYHDHLAVDILSMRVLAGTDYHLYTINAAKPWVLLQMLWLKTSDTNNDQKR